jgi:hypothetical protein
MLRGVSTFYWQCDTCHVQSSRRFGSMQEAQADRSYESKHSHHQIAYVADAS